jgi:GNAT superfamily N-acetyltransferase
MEQLAMIKYTGATEEDIKPVDSKMLSRPVVHDSVRECLAAVNGATSNNNFRFRLSTGEDVDTIARLVQGLAIYEKEPDAVNVTTENYRCDGGSNEPLFYCLLLEDVEGTKPYCCGMAFIFFGYELGRGRFLYLEDLYLEEAYRKRGGGSLAMKSLATISLALECQNFYWVALDWNAPALNLYEKIGAKVQKGVLIARFTDQTLKSFANATLERQQ